MEGRFWYNRRGFVMNGSSIESFGGEPRERPLYPLHSLLLCSKCRNSGASPRLPQLQELWFPFQSSCSNKIRSRTRARKFLSSLDALSAFPEREIMLLKFSLCFQALSAFFVTTDTRFRISRLLSGRCQLFPPREIVRRKFSHRFQVLSAFFATKTRASGFLASFSGR